MTQRKIFRPWDSADQDRLKLATADSPSNVAAAATATTTVPAPASATAASLAAAAAAAAGSMSSPSSHGPLFNSWNLWSSLFLPHDHHHASAIHATPSSPHYLSPRSHHHVHHHHHHASSGSSAFTHVASMHLNHTRTRFPPSPTAAHTDSLINSSRHHVPHVHAKLHGLTDGMTAVSVGKEETLGGPLTPSTHLSSHDHHHHRHRPKRQRPKRFHCPHCQIAFSECTSNFLISYV